MEFPKIQTLWIRQNWATGRKKGEIGNIIEGVYSREEFRSISKWQATEKIDGMNIRIFFDGKSIKVRGRNDNAQIHVMLQEWIRKNIPIDVMQKVCGFGGEQDVEKKYNKFVHPSPNHEVILFGEGYGRKIQQGDDYYKEGQKFILFDVVINGRWLIREEVETFAAAVRSTFRELHNRESELKTVPILPFTTEAQIIDYVKAQPPSIIAENNKLVSEGVVVTSDPMMFDKDGNPIRWKLKTADYRALSE